MEVTARPATAADLEVLADLAEIAVDELTPHRGGAEWRSDRARTLPADQRLAEELADDAYHLVVGCLDDVAVGYAAIGKRTLLDGRLLGEISDLFTLEGARGVGIGEAMMNALVAWATDQGCFGVDALALPGDRHTKNFFESFGLKARLLVVHRNLDA